MSNSYSYNDENDDDYEPSHILVDHIGEIEDHTMTEAGRMKHGDALPHHEGRDEYINSQRDQTLSSSENDDTPRVGNGEFQAGNAGNDGGESYSTSSMQCSEQHGQSQESNCGANDNRGGQDSNPMSTEETVPNPKSNTPQSSPQTPQLTDELSQPAMPSVERRRQRRRNASQTRADTAMGSGDFASSNYWEGVSIDRGGNSAHGWWMGTNTVMMGVISILVFVFCVQQDKIIHDIRRSRQNQLHHNPSNATITSFVRQAFQISLIFICHIILSPLGTLWDTVQHILHLLFFIFMNPLRAPGLITHLLSYIYENTKLLLYEMHRGVYSLLLPILKLLGIQYKLSPVMEPNAYHATKIGEKRDDRDRFSGEAHGQNKSGLERGFGMAASISDKLSNISFSSSNIMPELERVDSEVKEESEGEGDVSAATAVTVTATNLKKDGGVAGETKATLKPSTERIDVVSKTHGRSKKRVVRYDMEGLEPAFLKEDQYPTGWLVYRPRYGVITREEALQLERNAERNKVLQASG